MLTQDQKAVCITTLVSDTLAEILANVVNAKLSETFETIFFYLKTEKAPLEREAQDGVLAQIANSLIASCVGEIVAETVATEAQKARVRAQICDATLSALVNETVAAETRQLIGCVQRETARIKMLLADAARRDLIDSAVAAFCRKVLPNLMSREALASEVMEQILSAQIATMLDELIRAQFEAEEMALQSSWVASLPDYKYLSAEGRRLLCRNKLLSQEIFLKIAPASLAAIAFSTKDAKLVNSWWQLVNTSQSKSQPKRFSIASILGTKENCEENEAKARDEPLGDVSSHLDLGRVGTSEDESAANHPRRKSILDEIRDLQQSLQGTIDPSSSKTPQCGTKGVFEKANLTPHPPTPGKDFPRTPATPLKTPKDYRSDFQKDLPQNQNSPDIAPNSPEPAKQTAFNDPEPQEEPEAQPTQQPTSLLDLPMPNLIDLSKSTAEDCENLPKALSCARKRRKTEPSEKLSRTEETRKLLQSRSSLSAHTIAAPEMCTTRAMVSNEEKDHIRLVDNYRLDSIIGEGTFGQVFRGKCQATEAIVALKKVRLDREREGFPITAIREVKLLSRLDHDNIVKLHGVVQAKDLSAFFLVFEYVDNDLTGIIENRTLSQKQIKVSKLSSCNIYKGAAYKKPPHGNPTWKMCRFL